MKTVTQRAHVFLEVIVAPSQSSSSEVLAFHLLADETADLLSAMRVLRDRHVTGSRILMSRHGHSTMTHRLPIIADLTTNEAHV